MKRRSLFFDIVKISTYGRKISINAIFSYLQKTVFDIEFNLHFLKITVEYLSWDLAGLNIPTSSALTTIPAVV